jgi:hypothetical protein
MNYILCLKLYGVQVSKPYKLMYEPKINLYLYPKDYFSRISEVDEFQRVLNSPHNDLYNCLKPEPLYFKVGNDKFTYLIVNCSIDIYQDERALIQEIRDIFDLFLRIHSFIFDSFIQIQKILIFSKSKGTYQLKRMLDINIPVGRNDELVFIYHLQNYNSEINLLFSKINESQLFQDVVRMLFELTVAKNYSDLETRMILTWNFLEHIAYIYASHNDRNFLIDEQKYEIIQEDILAVIKEKMETISQNPLNLALLEQKIREQFNDVFNRGKSLPMEKTDWRALLSAIVDEIKTVIKESDILIDGYSKEKVTELIIKYLDNFPPSEILINLMLNDIKYQMNENETRTLSYMKTARNYFFHTSLRLEGLYQKLIDDYDDISEFDINDLKQTLENFEAVLLEVTAKMFNSSIINQKRVKLQGESGVSISYPFIEEHIKGLNSMINTFKREFDSIQEYKELLRIIIENDEKYDDPTNFSVLKGYCQGQDDQEYLRCELTFIKKFYARVNVSGTISYPQFYAFFMDLKKNGGFEAFMKLNEQLQLGSLSRPKTVSINIIDYWYEQERVITNNKKLLGLLNSIDYDTP